MSADATVSPSAARIARARDAGLRPSSSWLGAGIALCGLAFVLPASVPEIDAAALAPALADGGGDALAVAGDWLQKAMLPAIALAALALLAAVAAAVLADRLGAVSGDSAEIPVVRPSLAVALVIAGPMLLWFMNQLRTAIAAGARGADASEAGLEQLWPAVLARLAFSIGAAMVAFAAVDIVISRRRQLGALRTTVDEARREAERSRRR